MASNHQDRHPTFHTPSFDSNRESTGSSRGENGEWERASTIDGDNDATTNKPEENVPEAAHVGTTLREKEERSAGSEPETFDKIEITEDDCMSELGYSWPEWKKWTVLTVIFLVQLSMNFNTSLYSNGLGGISEEYGVSAQAARCGAMIFLVMYAFGCELWAPWSEEFGRWPILQLSLTLVNIWQLPVALAPNFGSLMVGRALGGLSSAGGSVTLGMIADLWDADNQQYAVAYVVFSSVFGSVLGPIIGGFVEQYLAWRWAIWIQLIFGGFVQAAHFFLVPETRTTILMDRIAKKRRKATGENIWGPNELEPFRDRFSVREVLITWMRPFKMFLTEPIVLTLSLLSGFSDALIFMFIQSFALVYGQWHFSAWQTGLAFLPLGIGYLLAWISFIPAIKRNIKERERNPGNEKAQYESRLWWLLWTAPCLPIGLFGFAWTIQGPPIHWIGSMIFSAIVGIANYAIYMATIDYMICAYGPYSASATGGNGWARDFLAGVLTIPATPFFENIGGRYHLNYAATILACIATLLVVAVYAIYWWGPELRKRSPFAQSLAEARVDNDGRRLSYLRSYSGTSGSRRASRPNSIQQAKVPIPRTIRPIRRSHGAAPAIQSPVHTHNLTPGSSVGNEVGGRLESGLRVSQSNIGYQVHDASAKRPSTINTAGLAELTVEELHTYNNLLSLEKDHDLATSPPPFAGTGISLSTSEKIAWQIHLASALPPRSHCDLFIAYFFESINWIYQAIHAPSFRQKYESLWEYPVKDVDLVWIALLYVLISLTALYIDPKACESVGYDASDIRNNGHLWFRLSRQALHAGEYDSRPCLTQIQVFIQSQSYWYATKAVEALNSAMGQAVRCAQAIHLDKDRDPATNLTSELRHRLWWDLCCSDTYQSLCLDRQPLIQAHLSDVPLPQNCEDCDITSTMINCRPLEEPTVMTVHVLRAGLFKVLSKLYANNASASTSYEEVCAIDQEILTIVDQFPWYLKTHRDQGRFTVISPTLPPVYDHIQWQHHLIHNSICVQRIRMYRPFLRSPFHNDCWSKCIEAVEGAFAVYHAIRNANPVRFQRSQKMVAQSYQIFCSAVSIAVFLLVERPALPSRMQSDIEVVIQDLQRIVQNHSSIPMAVAGRVVLTKILDAYNLSSRQQQGLNHEETVSNSNWHTLIPEIYAHMGGQAKTKTYLDRCAVSHIVNRESSMSGSYSPLNLQSKTTSKAGVITATEPTYMTNDSNSFDADFATSFGFDLHFDVLSWGIEDFEFQ
ncbi:hypothetical protein PV08_08734 [Exophiala spinifera]|uniref:Major facilitator superfamily (MFS) profile domain-containing protein n=1 Tax=Exophiala spinifera TaxID=91928 RepID=A0A0D1YES0_9EURO|nr:uncharacterized protein PV08_08734 [Exophiala spinifera]KIW13546.1 hypothetical protein PV08_08734 [Exophiala spinifera]